MVLNVTGRAVQLQIELHGPVRLFSFGFECLTTNNKVAAKNDDSAQGTIRAARQELATRSSGALGFEGGDRTAGSGSAAE